MVAYAGDHEAILDRSLFDAVQVKLAASANVRQLKLRASPSILAGRIFDDRGNRMTPTHTNKNGARYRYYISHALLQRRNDKATRVSAHEIERAVTKALRCHINDSGADERSSITDQELVEQLVERVIITLQMIEIQLRQEGPDASKSAIPAVLKVRLKRPEVPNGNRHAGRYARLRPRPRGDRHYGLQAQSGRSRRHQGFTRGAKFPFEDHTACGR